MTSFFLYIKHRCVKLWDFVEKLNGPMTIFFFPKIRRRATEVLEENNNTEFEYTLVEIDDLEKLIHFRENQRNDYLRYFDPHRFDTQTLTRMLENPAYVMMKVKERGVDGPIIGYFFLRCFFIGKAFHGLIVDETFTNRGIGSAMWRMSAEICSRLRLRMYATVSSHNQASLSSARNGASVKVTESLDNDYLLIECRQKQEI